MKEGKLWIETEIHGDLLKGASKRGLLCPDQTGVQAGWGFRGCQKLKIVRQINLVYHRFPRFTSGVLAICPGGWYNGKEAAPFCESAIWWKGVYL